MSVAEAFDMIPPKGSMLMCYSIAELQHEADRRNARMSGEWYGVAVQVYPSREPIAVVTRTEHWEAARDDVLLGVMRFATRNRI